MIVIWKTESMRSYGLEKRPLDGNIDGKMSSGEFITSTRSAGNLALTFHACYERSSDGREKLDKRHDNAEKWYIFFGGL